MSPAKQKKIYQVAKELNIATPAIVEFLEDCGFEVSKKPKHMSPITEEMYTEVIKKFDPIRWQKQLDEEAQVLEDSRRAESEKARTEQLRKLLDENVGDALKAAESLIKQVQEQKEERARKEIEQREQEKAEKLAEETRKAEAVKQEEDKQAAEEKRKTEAEKKTKAKRKKAAEKVEEGKEEKPEKKPRRKKKEAAVEAEAEPAAVKAKRKAVPAAGEKKPAEEEDADKKPKTPRKRRASKQDIERIEKQKKLLAAQKAEKHRKTVAAPVEHRRRKQRRKKVDQKEVEASVKQTLASMDTAKKRHRRKDRTTEIGSITDDGKKLKVTEYVTNQELSNLMDIEVNEIIKKFFSMGKMVSINQRLDRDLIEVIADEFGYEVEFTDTTEQTEIADTITDAPEDLVPRPPVVTVMGHVDHGKTTLLDFLRHASVAARESGGITQHVGAYEVVYNNRKITFLDTPGHEAFTAMRARGAQITDIVVLVVAADDAVQPQTVEAINHAQSADVPIVVAINKIDKPGADPEKVRKQLSEHGILVEQWGGKIQSAEVSAKTGEGVDNLLEEVLLSADVLELKANPNRRARGTIVETRLDKGRGIIATIVITNGTLNVGDNFVAGQQFGKVRALYNEAGLPVENATPGQPVQCVGLSGAPQAGDVFAVFESEREVKEIAMRRQLLHREQTFRQIRMMSLDQISERIAEGGVRELSLIIKGDADGSVEAICDNLQRLSTNEVAVKVASRGVGAISESDVLLASATGSIILGFHVHPNLKARELANREHVDIRVYRVIYELQDEIRTALEGMLTPDTKEEIVGLVEIRELFRIPKIGIIAGSHVVSGKIDRSSKVRLLRDGREIWRGGLASLKRLKNDASEVKAGYDCGIGLAGDVNIEAGDTLEVFETIEIKRKLETASS